MQDEVKVTQAARDAAENFMNAHGWLCEEEWTQVLEADREVIVKFFAKFEQSIRHQAERETLARMEPVAWQHKHPFLPDDFSADRLTKNDKADGWTETPLFTLPPAPEAGQ